MSQLDQPNAPVVLTGFMPGKTTRCILAALALAVGAGMFLPFLIVILNGYTLDAQETGALRVVALLTTLFAAFWLGVRTEIAFDPATAVITKAWSFFGLGRHRSYPLTAFYQVRMERRFRNRVQVARIRFRVDLIGTAPTGKPITIHLGSFFTMTDAAEKAEQISRLTHLPIDFVNNATPADALENIKEILTFPIRMHLAITRIGWWPLSSLIRNLRKGT